MFLYILPLFLMQMYELESSLTYSSVRLLMNPSQMENIMSQKCTYPPGHHRQVSPACLKHISRTLTSAYG